MAQKPCDVYAKANSRKRTLTVRSDAPEITFVTFNDPDHCGLCRTIMRMHTDDKPLETISPK